MNILTTPDPVSLALAHGQTIDLCRESAGECLQVPGPCDHVCCRYHLACPSVVDRIRAKAPQDLCEPCAIRWANTGGITLEEIGDMLGVCRERVRQLMDKALAKCARRAPELREVWAELQNRPDVESFYPAPLAGRQPKPKARQIAPGRW